MILALPSGPCEVTLLTESGLLKAEKCREMLTIVVLLHDFLLQNAIFSRTKNSEKKPSNRLYSPTCSRTPTNQHMPTKKDNHLPKHRGRYPCPLVITNVVICYPPSARHRVKAHTNDVQQEETWSLKRFDNDNVGHIFKLSAPNS